MLVQLASALQSRGWPQHVVSLRGRGVHADALEDAGVRVSTLNVSSKLKGPAGELRLIRLLRRVEPEILQGWMYHGNLAAAFAHRLAPGANSRRLYWNLRASNMDSERYGGIIGWNARFSGWPDIVIANSEAGQAFHREQGFTARREAVIHNGIDTEKYRPNDEARKSIRAELGIASDAIVAIHIARVDPMKDHKSFLDAMDACPDVTGLMIGLGTRKLEHPSNVMALGLRHDIERLYPAADLVVSSSAFGEGFSNATGEGMAAGLVPVVTDVGDSRIIVADTGQVVPPCDFKALAAAIRAEAEAGNKAMRERGLRARQRILDSFALESAVDAFAALYDHDGGA